MLVCLSTGALVANNVPDLVPISEMDSVQVPADLSERQRGQASALSMATPDKVATEGCNVAKDDDIDKALYAFDVFIPLLDIRQECAFTIARENDWLRAARAAYAVLGWIIVSLTILTFSGVLRRDLEG